MTVDSNQNGFLYFSRCDLLLGFCQVDLVRSELPSQKI